MPNQYHGPILQKLKSHLNNSFAEVKKLKLVYQAIHQEMDDLIREGNIDQMFMKSLLEQRDALKDTWAQLNLNTSDQRTNLNLVEADCKMLDTIIQKHEGFFTHLVSANAKLIDGFLARSEDTLKEINAIFEETPFVSQGSDKYVILARALKNFQQTVEAAELVNQKKDFLQNNLAKELTKAEAVIRQVKEAKSASLSIEPSAPKSNSSLPSSFDDLKFSRPPSKK